MRGGTPPSADVYAYGIAGGEVLAYARNNLNDPQTIVQASLPIDVDYVYITTTSAQPVPEIDGSTIPLLAFIMGTIGLGLRKRQSLTAKADTQTPVAA